MTNTYQNLSHRGLSGFFRKHQHIIQGLMRQDRTGLFFFDDFVQGGAAESSTAFSWTGGGGNTGPMRYLAHGTASSVIKQLQAAADDEVGVLTLDCDADNDETYLTFDSTYNAPFGKISNAAGDNRPLWFEAKVRFSNIASATATVAKMIGLRANAAAATLDIPDGGATIAVDEFVGFRALSGDGNGMDAVYVDSAEVVHAEAATYTNLDIVADTWYTFGLHFDGTKTYFYKDGVQIGAGVLPSATNFPNAEPLKPYFGARLDGTDAANHADIDWWAFMRLDDLHIR